MTDRNSFRGPAPLHHTLLCGEKFTGLSLQTLDPLRFDHGEILAQTEHPGFSHSCSTVPELLACVAPRGAEMLIKGLQDLVYVPPRQERGWWQKEKSNQVLRSAPKITPDDRHLDWESWTTDRILRAQRVIGPLWNNIQYPIAEKLQKKRIIWAGGFSKFDGSFDIFPRTGCPLVTGLHSKSQLIKIRTCDGQVLLVGDVKIEGEKTARSWDTFKNAGMINLPVDFTKAPHDFAHFKAQLK